MWLPCDMPHSQACLTPPATPRPPPQGPYITEPNTPVAEMWQALHGHVDKKEHMVRGVGAQVGVRSAKQWGRHTLDVCPSIFHCSCTGRLPRGTSHPSCP